MIIQCQSCSKKFIVKNIDIPQEGRMVQCGYCSVTWHQMPIGIPSEPAKSNINEDLSVEKIMASDGKTYKFLGSQWAELLPSGKTGLFAKRKIGNELDKLTGRKKERTIQKRQKKIKEVDEVKIKEVDEVKIDTIEKVIDPSSESLDNEKQVTDAYRPRQGLGFFGYFFLIVIIGFSIVGVLRTFENDLLNYFPETEYVYRLLDDQSEYFAETVKNMIVIVNDLLNSY